MAARVKRVEFGEEMSPLGSWKKENFQILPLRMAHSGVLSIPFPLQTNSFYCPNHIVMTL